MNTILQNIRLIREELNFSQLEMAEKMNLTQSSYARFERGATKTDLSLIYKFCEVTNYTIIDVVTYPRKYVDIDDIKPEQEDNKVVLQIELKKEKKDQVMKLIFGENNLEILNT